MPFVDEQITIWTAAKRGILDKVKHFVTSGTSVDARAKGGVTPLHEAAEAGQLEVANWLLDSGANINAKTDPQPGYPGAQTALYLAVTAKKTDVVKLLLERGANPNHKSSDGMSPLGEAAGGGDLDLVRLLVKYRAKVNPGGDIPPLLAALFARHIDIVRFLVDSGAAVTVKTIPFHCSLLMDTSSSKYLDGVNFLLDAGLNVNDQDDAGSTALHYAVLSFGNRTTSYGRNEKGEKIVTRDEPEDALPVVKRLLEVGADPTIRDKNGFTPLDYAKKFRAQSLLNLFSPIVTPKGN